MPLRLWPVHRGVVHRAGKHQMAKLSSKLRMNRLLNCNILETQYICISDTAPTDIAAAMKIQLFANAE